MDNSIYVVSKEAYPSPLKYMKSPPKQIYVRGRFSDNPHQKYVCIVGSRSWTPYGRDAVHKIVSGLQGYPISIISGLAIGIDSIAHTEALAAGLHCIAIPGSTLEWNKMYPHQHQSLAKQIVDSGGALVSQWNVGYPTGNWSFAARNRLMAGMSHATLIVEAAMGSGSLMTAKYAEDFDRDIMAVPGSITSEQSYGPHMLIQRGALLVKSSDDVLEALGFSVDGKKPLQQSILDTLSPPSQKILKEVSRSELTIDQLLECTLMPILELNQELSALELRGLIRINSETISAV